MPEPTTTSTAAAAHYGSAAIIGLASGALGPEFGPMAAIAVAGLIGAVISMGEAGTAGWAAAVRHVLIYTALAVVVSGTVAIMAARLLDVPAVELLLIVAAGVGLIGKRWRDIAAALAVLIGAVLQRKAGGTSSRDSSGSSGNSNPDGGAQ